MATATTTQVRSVQGDTVDLICWRTYGRTAGITEQVLEANPGLADLGAELPIGTLVTLPAFGGGEINSPRVGRKKGVHDV